VLVVDDEAVVRNFLKESLESKGYRVMLAKNGKEGVEQYRHNAKEISLVILDIIMPEMTGEEALKHIREINPDSRILITTGFAHDPERNDQLSKLAQGYLQKPFDHHDLLSKVREVLDGKSRAPTRQPALNQ
ncbi:MAG: response regulator, partial [bacterium]